ncbi:DNA helicase/exodeoxyribonuclease V, gamma subunit [Oceanospirillum multiglobuliferum]|uniref:RecBCD enzyme subunit RecC n=1 Tax=Oceanospirillum multiglobuliferum TaxID=64969 RepID=A0A1T4SGX9_9GAMM|nr:exodeoxyribonuclease V subunit gamma [Oceanospirillum multiglobuliferum]OPX54250.1 exodeoxyribonuclease V subunit gamma [Oceanospirillum multiglobuliferum]SKA27416.1 DNA helicase/exodeoxyribonuclease V, gamma subunit [Oceanospirillum multiglobuliferum]
MAANNNSASEWPTGFMVIQGNHLEDLRHVMVDWIERYPLQPLENEQILVQSNGIAQWLKLALAEPASDGADVRGFGIAAAVQVDLPGRFIWQAYRSLIPELPTSSPFDKAALTWRIYRLLSTSDLLEQPVFEPLQSFLAESGDNVADQQKRCYRLSAVLSDLFDQYQVYRADWLNLWLTGRDSLLNQQGVEVPLSAEQLWQPALWRLVSADIQTQQTNQDTTLNHSRSETHQQFLTYAQHCTWDNRPEELPRRVIVFGVSSLPQQTLEVLKGISHLSQVLLFVNNPSELYWGDIIEGRELLRQEYKRHQRTKGSVTGFNEAELHQYGHPLLASWGKQGRDYLHLLDEQDEKEQYQSFFDGRIDLFSPCVSPDRSHLLAQLQEDILQLRSLKERQGLQCEIAPESDQSIRFSIVHSPQREVEVLQDQLLAEFEQAARKGQKLDPRDILVMMPDINLYAPHIDAVFGRHAYSDPRFLPYHISDQGQRHRNSLLIAFEKLLKIEHSRFTVSELLDFIEVPAVLNRMGLSPDALPRIQHWVQGAQIRWGLKAEQKLDFGLPEQQDQNTWRFGLKRMLLGFATGQHIDHWQEIQPYAEVGGLEASLVGALVQLIDQLEYWWQLQKTSHNATQWAEHLHQLLDRFFLASHDTDQWALEQIEKGLERIQQFSQDANSQNQALPLSIVADNLLEQIDQPTLTQKFLGGSINFATLMPMRAVPFKQVWLLGMNDGDYPRSNRPADFDLMADHYRPGDRSRRDDDRYLLLEALLSARDKLVISWVGRNIKDNSSMPPSVLVGQLRDHLAAGWHLKSGTDGHSQNSSHNRNHNHNQERADFLAAITTEYPMQPFSPEYFKPTRDARLFTYGAEWRAVHDRADQAEQQRPLSVWYPESAVNIKQLSDFLRSPVDAFFNQRLQIYPPEEIQLAAETETYAFDGLGNWALKDQLIRQSFQMGLTEDDFAIQIDQFIAQKQREGVLIAGALGQHQAKQQFQKMPELYQKWHNLRMQYLNSVDNLAPLHLAVQAVSNNETKLWQFEALPSELYQTSQGDYGQICLSSSSLRKNRAPQWRNYVLPWLKHLVASVSYPSVTTHLLSPAGEAVFAPLSAEVAEAELRQLLQLWWLGMQQPIPLALNTGLAYLYQQGLQPEGCALDRADTDAKLADYFVKAFDKDLLYSAYLSREFADFNSLCQCRLLRQGGALGLAELSEQAYGKLYAQEAKA